jgi:hypothetical protein
MPVRRFAQRKPVGRISPPGPRDARPDDRLRRNPPPQPPWLEADTLVPQLGGLMADYAVANPPYGAVLCGVVCTKDARVKTGGKAYLITAFDHSSGGHHLSMTNIWVCKSTAILLKEADGQASLNRTLSALTLAALGVGGIIGAGIFILTGQAAAANAGPAISLSFLLGAVACAFAGLCYAEMASTVPISGSAYTFAYATLGELVAWIIGWDLILEYAVGAATVAIGWSGYVVSLAKDFGLDFPVRLVSAPFNYDAAQHTWSSTGAVLNVPAAVIIIVATALLVAGIRETARVNNFIVVIKLIVIALFIVCALPAFSTANWITSSNPEGNFIPPNAGAGIFGWSGVVRGAAVVFFCLYRVRFCLDSGTGGQKPKARYAYRYYGLANCLCGAVRRG